MDKQARARFEAPVSTALSNNPLRVLMAVSSYPRTAEDSSSVFLRYLTESLHRRGVVVHVVAPADGEADTTRESGITVRRFRYWPWGRQGLAYGSGILPNLKKNVWLWLQVPFFVMAMIVTLLRTTRRLRPDLIHAHWVLPQGFAAMLAKRLYGVPIVITAHGGDAFALRGRFLRRMKHLCLRKSDAWTANTRVTAGALGGAGVPAARVIPMGVDVRRFASGDRLRLRADTPADARIVLFVGRLVEKKGVDDLLQAFALLPPEIKLRTRLWVVGGGEQESGLRNSARSLGIADRTTFWGRIQNDQLPDYYAAADLFVGPSVVAESGDTEGQGVVFLEAFAARLCVLATKTGGIGEVIEDGRTGILVEPRNPRQLADAMASILTDDARRSVLAASAYKKVSEHYDWQKIAEDFEGLYQSLLGERSKVNLRAP